MINGVCVSVQNSKNMGEAGVLNTSGPNERTENTGIHKLRSLLHVMKILVQLEQERR